MWIEMTARRDGTEQDTEAVVAWYRETAASDYGRYIRSLSAEEKRQCLALRCGTRRCDYANAHDLLRRALSQCGHCPPSAWRFQATSLGRPYLVPPFEPADASLTFSLSHTRGFVGCVIGRVSAVGIDV